MTTTKKKTTGREYLRVSQDKSGRTRSVDEQHDDNERAAADRGVALGEPYEDNSVSASRYTTKTRDGFDRLFSDLDKGRFGADELWLWESSRGSRRVGEWVELVEACERAGVTIFVTSHDRVYDPANGRDRRSLLEDAVDSEYESSKISVRGKRAAAADAAKGKPHGPVPFGYRRRYEFNMETGRQVKTIHQEPDLDEAPVIRELYDRLRKGHSLRSIAIDFATREVRTRTGKPFSAQHLRDLVLTPVYVGLRVHAPKDKNGNRPRHSLDGAVKGQWEPLVSEETFYEVRRMLTRPERKTSRGGRAVHLLSMIAKCNVCGGPLAVTFRHGGPQYQCHLKGCVRVDKAELDALAEEAILGFLARKENYEALTAADLGDDDLQRVRNEVSVAQSELEELLDGVDAGILSVATLMALEPGLRKRVAALEEQERDLSTPSEMRGMVDPDLDVRPQWANMPISTRRNLARMVLSAERVGELCVERRPRDAGNRHVPAHQRVHWRSATAPRTVTSA
jgi:site-specific DNA recombinase